MRLTLRTLLAYLDDTLEPAAARELGQKLTETPAAQELVSRIREVTRRRRLTAPPVAGDEIEPNELSEYVDNLLTPDEVARIERVCLDSDVHLAEVAACHQILTLIGQPARVTDPTKKRMYELVHAIESMPADRRNAARRAERAAILTSPTLLSARPLAARFLSAAAVVIGAVGIGVLVWITFNWSGEPARDTKSREVATVDKDTPADDIFRGTEIPRGQLPAAPNVDATATEPEKRSDAEADRPTAPSGTPRDTQATSAADAKDVPADDGAARPATAKVEPAESPPATTVEAPPKPAADLAEKPAEPGEPAAKPAGPAAPPIANFVSTAGVLMRLAPGSKEWRRLAARAPIAPAESLLCLPFQRAALQLESGASIELVGETELAIVEPTEEGIIAHVKLDRGRVVLGANQPNAAFRVDFHDQSWRVLLKAAEREVGFSLAAVWQSGGPDAREATLYVPIGEVELLTAAQAGTLGGPVQLRWSSIGGLREKESLAGPPAWMEREEMTPSQIRAAAAIEQVVPKDASPVLSLIEAKNSDRRDQRVMAVRSLGAIGRLPAVIDAMGTLDRREVRQEAIGTLRQYLARGPANAEAVSDALFLKLNKDRERVDGVMKLLRGLTDAEAKNKDAYDALIKLLSVERAPELGIRELAITNLEELAGKLENTVYSPDKPTDTAISAWRRALDTGRLPPRERGKM